MRTCPYMCVRVCACAGMRHTFAQSRATHIIIINKQNPTRLCLCAHTFVINARARVLMHATRTHINPTYPLAITPHTRTPQHASNAINHTHTSTHAGTPARAYIGDIRSHHLPATRARSLALTTFDHTHTAISIYQPKRFINIGKWALVHVEYALAPLRWHPPPIGRNYFRKHWAQVNRRLICSSMRSGSGTCSFALNRWAHTCARVFTPRQRLAANVCRAKVCIPVRVGSGRGRRRKPVNCTRTHASAARWQRNKRHVLAPACVIRRFVLCAQSFARFGVLCRR